MAVKNIAVNFDQMRIDEILPKKQLTPIGTSIA
jgi:hypothetical protein